MSGTTSLHINTLPQNAAASSKSSSTRRGGGSQTPTSATGGKLGESSSAISNPTTNPSSPNTVANSSPKRGVKNRKPSNAAAGGATGGGVSVTGANKRRCVSNACIACRKRKSKCDGNLPSCAACASVYGTDCIYDPTSDHRRKGVYKKDIDNLKTRNSTLQALIQAILDYPEDQVAGLVHAIRTSDNLEEVAESIAEGGKYGLGPFGEQGSGGSGADNAPRNTKRRYGGAEGGENAWNTVDRADSLHFDNNRPPTPPLTEATFESEISHKMSQLRVDAESGQVRFIGGTSNLILLPAHQQPKGELDVRSRAISPMTDFGIPRSLSDPYASSRERNPVLSWTIVLSDEKVILHLVNMYFAWHYPYFTTLSRDLFNRDFIAGYSPANSASSPYPYSSPSPPAYNPGSPSAHQRQVQKPNYCTPLLVNAILALGCHFTSHPLARLDPENPDTVGDHFFKECKRLILENDEHETSRLTTVQALALMSVREAGCGREDKGWSYSGMSFRMGIEMGLHLDLESRNDEKVGEESKRLRPAMSDEEIDARRVTFWGCFLFDKCWSNYMGRMPQLHSSIITVPKYIIIPSEDAANWSPYTDVGVSFTSCQPARTRAIALQISELCDISSDILMGFYNPNPNTPKPKSTGSAGGIRTHSTGSEKAEIRKLGDLWNRLEDWKRGLPRELEGREGSLPPVLLMHMFHQLLYIHLFRPFLKYDPATLPALTNLEPRKICVQAASTISKHLRFYKREYGLRQICNIAAYIIHSACTIHLLNLPAKSAKRDVVQGLRSLEDMSEGWLCARRALVIMRILAKKWKIELPDEAVVILTRAAKGRAEMFGLQEVADEEGEDYLQYRGSSLSAISPSSTNDRSRPSPLPHMGSFNEMRKAGGAMEIAMGGMEVSSSSPSVFDSPGLGPVVETAQSLQQPPLQSLNRFSTPPSLSQPLHGLNPDIGTAATATAPPPTFQKQTANLRQQRSQHQSQQHHVPHVQSPPVIHTAYSRQPYGHNPYLDLTSPTTTGASQAPTSAPMVPTLTNLTNVTQASTTTSIPSTTDYHAHHSYYMEDVAHTASSTTGNPRSPAYDTVSHHSFNSHHSDHSDQNMHGDSPLPHTSHSLSHPHLAISYGHNPHHLNPLPSPLQGLQSVQHHQHALGTTDHWWLRDQTELARDFVVVDSWLAAAAAEAGARGAGGAGRGSMGSRGDVTAGNRDESCSPSNTGNSVGGGDAGYGGFDFGDGDGY